MGAAWVFTDDAVDLHWADAGHVLPLPGVGPHVGGLGCGVSPVQVHVVASGNVIDGNAHSDHVAPPSVDAQTAYKSIAKPPLSTGGVHDTSTDVAVAFDPTTPVGAPGTVGARTAAEAADHAPGPAKLMARTWKM